jgi:hypothetical protein
MFTVSLTNGIVACEAAACWWKSGELYEADTLIMTDYEGLFFFMSGKQFWSFMLYAGGQKQSSLSVVW